MFSFVHRWLRPLVIAALALVVFPLLAYAYLSTGPTGDRTWFWQNQTPQGNSLRAMSWADASNGWAVGTPGTVLRTSDGGRTWAVQDPGTTRDLTGVSFTSATRGWIVGLTGTVRTTSDGGTTWTAQTSGTTTNLRAVSFATSNIGVAVGDTGTTTSTIRYTADGGATWRAASTTSTVGLTDVEMVSATTGWAVGGAGQILRTLDGGATWTVRPSPTTAGLSAISFAPGGTVGYLVGNAVLPNWTIYRTTNSGATWTAVSGLGATGAINLFGVDVLDSNNAVTVGANGQIRRTTDGGATWLNQSQNNVGATALRAVKLFSATGAYAIGDIGSMFYSTNGGDSWFTLLQGSLATWRASSFSDANNGWVVGTNGAVMRTADAGQTWEQQAGGIRTYRAVHFVSSTTGWLVGDNGIIRKTTNGRDWVAQTSGTTQQLNGVWFLSPTTGIAVGNNGVMRKTTDGGATWSARASGTGQAINAIWFANATTGYLVGNNGIIRKTTNGGETWNGLTSGTGQTLLTVRGVSANTVWVGGNGGVLRKTTNGSTWSGLTPGVGTNPIRTLFFTDANTGWLGSTYGIVKKTTNGGTTWTSQNAGMPTVTTDAVTGVYTAWFADGNTGYFFGDAGAGRRTIDGGAAWASVQHGTLSTLNSVSFADALNGWAGGTGGAMMYTGDGGQTWVQQRTGSTASMNDVRMSDAFRGWAVGDNGTIRRTADGGLTWLAQTSGVTANLSAIASGDATHAIAAGQGVVKYTTNAGSTWTSATAPPTLPVTGLSMVGNNDAWAVTTRISGNNSVWHSADGGVTWAAQPTLANANLWDVHFRTSSVGYATGDSGVILKTTDGGATWVRKTTPTTLPLYRIGFMDADTGWAVGGAGVILLTVDAGETWTLQSSGTGQSLNGIAFSGTGRGFIVGGGGSILRNEDLTAPTTTYSIAPAAPNGSNGWYAFSAPTITLSSSEPGNTYYGWVSSAGPFSAYSAPFAAIEGTATVYFYSTDALGNAEIVSSRVLHSDVTSPTVATGLGETAVATSSATVAWLGGNDSVSGVDHYDVYLDGTYVASTNTTSVDLVGLNASTLYSVAVRTVDVAGNISDLSAPDSFTTNAIVTTPYLTVMNADPLAPDGENGWYVTTPTVTLASLPMSGGPRTTYYSWVSAAGPYSSYSTTITPPAGASTLYYSTHDDTAVRADEPTQSAPFKVDTQTPVTPSVTATSTSYQSILATWAPVASPPSGIDHYDVYVDGGFQSLVTTAQVEITGLLPLTTYSITVRSHSSAGATSTLSAAVNATTPAPPLPAAPTAVLAKAPTGDTVYMNWSASEDASGAVNYHVWRSGDGVTYSVVATTTGGLNDCAYIDTGLRSSTRYWYAVSTIDARGESSLSSTAPATWAYTAPTTLRPDRVVGVTASGLDNAVHLTWQASADPGNIGYVIRRGTASMSTMTTISPYPAVVTGTGYFDVTAVNGQTYYYQVVAVNDALVTGMPSVDVEARPVAPYPANQPHPHYYGNESGCICHGTHSSTTLEPLVRFPGATDNTLCQTCHAPVTSYGEFLDPLLKSKHPEGATVTAAEPFSCVTCHAPLIKDGEPLNNLMRVNTNTPCVVVTDTPAGNGFCYSCHGTDSTLPMGDLTVFEASGHRTLPAPGTGANITCNVCHESHSSRNTRLLRYEGFMVCVQCHTASATNPNQADILGRLTLNEGANTKHPLLPQDQLTGARMSCQNCHNTHTTTVDFPLVDPHNPGPTGTWTTPRSDEKAFCFRCHDGDPLPTSAETTPWAEPVLARSALTTTSDIEARYSVNTHGFASRSGSTTTTAYLRTDMGYAYGDVLECRSCHDPHGTANNDAVLDTVKSANGAITIYGVLTYKIPSGGKDFRFFCATCHVWDSASHDTRAGTNTTVFPTNCKACHGHSIGTPTGVNF